MLILQVSRLRLNGAGQLALAVIATIAEHMKKWKPLTWTQTGQWEKMQHYVSDKLSQVPEIRAFPDRLRDLKNIVLWKF